MPASPLIRALRDQRGFTLIEVMAAMLILIGGVLGTVALIDGANASTSLTKARVGATNLARELTETSRSIDYDTLTTAALAGGLQANPDLDDSNAMMSGWQLERRGITYTVVASACTFDDATDGTEAHDATFCSSSATSPGGDTNPDDYRRVSFDVTWESRGEPGKVSQSALVINPSGGLGPRITAFDGPLTWTSETTPPAYSVKSTAARTVHWSADDGMSDDNAGGGPTVWSFTWALKLPGAWSCSTRPDWQVDGAYVLNAQAFDSRGIPGDLKTKTVTLDRSDPAPPCGLKGGRNGSIFDLEWSPNPERDIKGYEVYRRRIGAEAVDPIVCSLTTRTECIDEGPPATSISPVSYYVVAMDGGGPGGQSADESFPQGANLPPSVPPQLNASIVDGQPVLTWTAATDPDGTIQFYRVYRDGTALGDRYGATSGPQLSFTDKGETGHQYWVTAVDAQFAESAPVGPVTP
ncbi:MAG: prepilin-type N-terminal cleavage/methylation domain-containing protein [Actinomycetota bacterium]|nr:prepilin-type N-terminal cleavage/methylation domain-containing protein [Actinomycetota bacterium]